MANILADCPCSGKHMSNLAAPWILLTLYQQGPLHGYRLTRIIGSRVGPMGGSLNMAGLYRHLNLLEERGMLVSEWDLRTKGPARRKYALTESGTACLLRWMQTLAEQRNRIDHFLELARDLAPDPQWATGSIASTERNGN
ncbi:putative transcriptional regulator [Desulfosarcina cetonica]|uniref:PadR family transcriptional regulator n=1 Tax=Desulfosarcina cetonica TaxID=90730 RepID=UPI0006CF296D|nr:helix-turn-helix transcriptional regulator [Desulfosarcina cetonica]VTR71032.1 putative transcriptional regulator [Desulfosarcina cetonica]